MMTSETRNVVMPPRKKKKSTIRIISDEILSNRRSSLRVNLSYLSNMSDSGNESFKSTRLENDSKMTERNRMSLNENQSPETLEKGTSRVPVGNPVLSEMRKKETALSESCQLLKEAIMHKTREIFDGEAELALKTATILRGQRKALKEINKDPRIDGTRTNLISSNITQRPGSKNYSSRKASENGPSARTLKSLSRISGGNESVVLSGSDKRDGVTSRTNEKVLEIRLTRINDPRLESSLESDVSDIGAPITCSSFINNYEYSDDLPSKKSARESTVVGKNFDEEESAGNVQGFLSSPMQITAVETGLPTAGLKSFASLRRSEVSKVQEKSNRISYEPISMELTSVQSHIPFFQSSSSDKTTRTSLNVNTSTVALFRKSESKYIQDCEESSNNCGEYNSQNNQDAEVSLKVNTSLATEESEGMDENHVSSKTNPTPSDKNEFLSKDNSSTTSTTKNVEKSGKFVEDDDCDSIENMSLIDRLRNLSTKKFHRTNRSSINESPSFVEGTPYPPSRSFLWKTRIRSEMIGAKKNQTSVGGKANLSAKNSHKLNIGSSVSSNEYTTAPDNTVIVNDSPCRITCKTNSPRVIQDSSGEDEPKKVPDENTARVVKKPGKKKLLPLGNNFEIVSFSPVSQCEPTPKNPITWKPRKHFRKRKSVRAVAEKRIEALVRENEDDEDEPGTMKKDDVKTQGVISRIRKPRKVISKKIVVKKFANNDLLERIGRKNSDQSFGSERVSMNDFLKKKKFSVTERNLQPKKLVLVATGFSKGDLDLVKTVVKELGGAEITSTVTRRTTHVVSTGVRTINLLRGIIRGCWMVSLEWVLKSLEMKKWLNAENYEMVHFSKAVQENRRDRQIFGKSYVPELFTTCGPIYIEHGTSPPPEILKELIKTAGGITAENPREARLKIGSDGLREIWVLDSITTGDLQPVEEYRRKC